jgi:hypothetical protein
MRRLAPAALLVVTVSGCGDDAGGSVPEGSGSGYRGCDETAVVHGLDQVSPLGFAATDVLAHASSSAAQPLHWSEDWVFRPANGAESTISLAVEHRGGGVRYVSSTHPDGEDPGRCKDRVEVDVALTVSTADGALSETVAATMTATHPRHAEIEAALDPAKLDGGVTISEPDDWTIVELTLHGGFLDGYTWGRLAVGLEGQRSESVVRTGGLIATWPTPLMCQEGSGIVLPLDVAYFSFTASDVLDALQDVTATMRWDDGGVSPLLLDVEVASDLGCIYVPPFEGEATGGIDGDAAGALIVPATLVAVTEDGRLDASLRVLLIAVAAEDGTLIETRLALDRLYYAITYDMRVPVEDFEEVYGIHGFDLTGYDGGDLEVTASFRDGWAEGRFEVSGLEGAVCGSVEEGADATVGGGCAGVDVHPLGGGSWTAP